MPAQQDETLDVVNIARLAVDIFHEDYIYFFTEAEEIRARFDRTQLIRVLTKLVKNSIPSVEQRHPEIPRVGLHVKVEGTRVSISVNDNGEVLPEYTRDFIFEPQFTLETSGIRLGLGMVKNI